MSVGLASAAAPTRPAPTSEAAPIDSAPAAAADDSASAAAPVDSASATTPVDSAPAPCAAVGHRQPDIEAA